MQSEEDLGLLQYPRWRNITKRSILNVAAALDPPLAMITDYPR